ncbi:4-hydroxy-tetrahydrodipicolinate synthase [Paenibacillus sp. GCM10023252]|uniref:4-hydroxy-tetrahydrodipicolinate synthase n=1 Tax=Paenibacillus sp. GCM10023252 TaxID=3252649 RepID=UPI00361F13E0
MAVLLRPHGIIPAMLTPFNAQDQVDEDALRQSVNRFIQAGVHGLFCLGTNGEFFSLTMEEKLRIVTVIVEEAAGRVPVYAGAGAITTRESVQLAEGMEAAGADALSVITPYFTPVSQLELTVHYKAIASATSLPIMLYHIPARTGVTLEGSTVEKLASVPNIVGVKDSSGSFDNILQLIDRTDGGDFSVLAGTDSLILWTLLAGGTGAVAGTANIAPRLAVSIYERWRNGDLEGAKQSQARLLPIRRAAGLGTIPAPFKEALNLLGISSGLARKPAGPLSEQAREELRSILALYNAEELALG